MCLPVRCMVDSPVGTATHLCAMDHMTAQQRTADTALRRDVGLSLEQWLRAQRANGETYKAMSQRLERLGVFASHEALRRWCADLDKEPAA